MTREDQLPGAPEVASATESQLSLGVVDDVQPEPAQPPSHATGRRQKSAHGSTLSQSKEDQWFLVFQPDAAARDAAIRYQHHICQLHGVRGSRVPPQNLHISLHWVGEGPALSEALLAAVRAAAASVSFPRFEIIFEYALTFGSAESQEQKPFVLRTEASLAALKTFHETLGGALRTHGIGAGRSAHVNPHMTLFRDPLHLVEHSITPISWTASDFVLVHSLYNQTQHNVEDRWPLRGGAAVSSRIFSFPRPSQKKAAAVYAEFHARSAFSFLRGGSKPKDIIAAASHSRLPALALLDRDGLYGTANFHSAAQEISFSVRPRVGAEITMEDGSVVPVLVATRTGYQNLCQLITEAKLTERPPNCRASVLQTPHTPDPRDRKRPCFATWNELARFNTGLIALTGDEEGPVRRAWRTIGKTGAADAVARLTAIFGRESDPAKARLFVELQRHRIRGEDHEVKFLRDLAAAENLPLLATGGVNYATRDHRIVADVFTCLRQHTTLDAAGRLLAINAERHVKSAAEMLTLFADLPVAIENSVRLESRLEFTLQNLGYRFPTYCKPDGTDVDQDEYLRAVTYEAARRKIGALSPAWEQQLQTELALIARLKFSGYFLIVWDICAWARAKNILVQGRGSAANSAVCYVLGITSVDPIKNKLLFDRFLNDSRIGPDGNPSWPDIDLDFPSGERRESVIQEVYRRYGRRGAAMTANVITYRGRSTIREIGKVLGFGEDALDRFSGLYANGDFPETLGLQEQLKMAGIAAQHPRAEPMVRLNHHIRSLPRHLGQHSGGMVISRHELDKVVPLEPATMPDRSVCQWDKEDCENLGIVKIDFLGLGMMAVLQETIELCIARGDDSIRALNDIPPDDPVTYDSIRAADTVGVFQIESRAQMATLPRFKPRDLYDLAMQVAIVRPGPITGNLVHPLIRRRAGMEPVDYIDPAIEHIVKPILERTKGVILFQEQMLQLAIKLAKFTGAEAEELRRAMGFMKDPTRLPRSMEKLHTALRREGYNDTVIQKVVTATTTFSAYGFPESHAIGFAQLAYASTWLKMHRTAEFYACLLNNQPMGFYSPATLLQDAKREGRNVTANPVCVQHSDWNCTVEAPKTIRLGLRYVRSVRETAAQHLLAARREKPFTSLDDFLRRTDFTATERRALAAVGALDGFAHHRRTALWQVEASWSDDEALFKQFADTYRDDSPLAAMSRVEEVQADFSGLGLTVGEHPMALVRDILPDVCMAKDLKHVANGQTVTIAGSVICRQRPGTAAGFVFISLEDETGIANAVVVPALFERLRLVITQEPSLKISGRLQNVSGVTHVKAEKIEALRQAALPAQASHDFH